MIVLRKIFFSLQRFQLNRWYGVLYISLALFLITLIPFEFHWQSAQQFKLYFDKVDIVQNIMLFFPLGVLLQNSAPKYLFLIVAYGAGLSTIIEFLQLFDGGRTSDYCDIFSNTLGTFIGAFFCRYLINLKTNGDLSIALVFMLTPMVWIVAMRSETQERVAWIILPLAAIGLSLLKKALADNSMKWLVLFVWFIISLIPLLYISRNTSAISFNGLNITSGLLILILIPLLDLIFSIFKVFSYRLFLRMLCLTVFLILLINSFWLLNRAFPIFWTVSAHLHWIDSLMGIMLLINKNYYRQS